MKIDSTMNDPQNDQCNGSEIHKKRKKSKAKQTEGASIVNGSTEMTVTYSVKKALKRDLISDENGTRKKRKKKSNNTELDEDDSIVKKTFEKSDESTETKQFTLPKDDNARSSNEDSEGEKITEKEIEQLSGKRLRTSLGSPKGLDMLKKFVKVSKENKDKDVAADYLNAGGNLLEILKLLGSADKKNIGTATTVFSAIQILIMKVLAQYPQYQFSAEEACRHLIHSHLSLIHSMLSLQSNAKQRKTILQLLAAMVSLGGNISRELLAHLNLQSQVIESLARHTKLADKQSVRTCFIHFVLAFLVEGNVSVIRALLDKRWLLSSIFPDLMYDSKDLVTLVLTTIKTYVLENSGISKTTKLYVFSTSVVQNFVCLYNWKGPGNWPKNKAHSTFTTSPEYIEEKKVVTDIVHNFLITLLTSHRHGIIFHDRTLGTSSVKHNQLVSTVLQSLDRPWEHEKPTNLIIKVLVACPDLMKSQFSLVEPFIEPRVSTRWITLMKFVAKMIEHVDAESCFKICSLELSASHLAHAITALIMPATILKNAIIPSLVHDSVIVRHQAILLLVVMFEQIQKLLSIVKRIYGDGADSSAIQSDVTEYIVKNIPNLDIILKVWSKAFAPSGSARTTDQDHVPEPEKNEHLSAILNLLHAYNSMCPELLHATVDVQPSTLLTTLDELQGVDTLELNTIKVKAIQFLLALDPTEFIPQKEIFSTVLLFLMSLLCKEASIISTDARTAIKRLLNASGLFEGSSDQLDIWIGGFVNIENLDERRKLEIWFVNIVKRAAQHVEKYVNGIIEAEEIVNDEITSDRHEDIFDELLNKDDTGKSLDDGVVYMQRHASVSPLLCCILRKVKKDSNPTIFSYVSYVLVHTLHHQVTPRCLIHLARDIDRLPVQKYLVNWLRDNQPVRVKKIFPSMSVMCKLSSALLVDEKIRLDEIFSGETVFNFKYGDEDVIVNHSLSLYEVKQLFRMIVFYLTQFAERGTLNETQNENCKILLTLLLRIAKENAAQWPTLVEECAKSIFTHPTVLQYFSPFNQKNPVKNLMTFTVFNLCTVIADLCEARDMKYLFSHFKNKLFSQLCKLIEKNQRGDKLNGTENIVSMLELVQLRSQDIVCLLDKLVELESCMFVSKDQSQLSIFGYVVPKLLEIVCSEKMRSERTAFFKLDEKFVTRLCSHLLFLKSKPGISSDQWETELRTYFSNFSYNIAGVNSSTFQSLLSTRITEATVQLIALLVEKSDKFIPTFTEYITKTDYIKEKSIVFPIIRSNLAYKWNSNFLQKLSQHYRSEILSYLSDPKNANAKIEENVEVVSYLIENTFDLPLCEKVCNNILQIGDKLEMVSIHYIRILRSLYKRHATLKANSEDTVMDLVQVLLHVTTLTLKKESKNVEKLDALCDGLASGVKNLRKEKSDFTFESLSGNRLWPQFTRFSLKLGLKDAKDGKQQIPILKTLNILCDIAYKNDDNEYVKTLFEMATSHSEFVNIMLGSSIVKKDLIELLWTLMQKNKTVLALTHVPLYLAAYNGTLGEADQFILSILQYYQKNNINIHEYRPYLWGNAAAIHFSVRGETGMALWRQPSTSQVLNLFEKDIVNNTIKHYPVDRALNSTELHKEREVYDPAFYLPLLCFLLSENNVVSCHKVIQSGALALVFSACGSSQPDVRMMAYTTISRYYAHLEASSSKAKLLWMRLIDALRYGVMSAESELSTVRLNCIVSTFLARTSLVATEPLNKLYSPLQTFLMAKPALDIKAIPELLQLFHSSDVDHRAHRHWILENVRDGMKTEMDVEIAFKYVLFKMLLDFYTCNLSDPDTKRLILEVVYATSKIPKAATLLVNGHGLLPWLLDVANNLRTEEKTCAELIIKIADELAIALSSVKREAVHYKFMLLKIVANLWPNLPKEIACFTLYVNVLRSLLTFRHAKTIITERDVKIVIEFSKRFLHNVEEFEDMLLHGCEYIKGTEDCKSLNEVEATRDSLKRLVITWCTR